MMKRILSFLGAVTLTSTFSTSVMACKNDDANKWLVILQEGFETPTDKLLKADIEKYSLAKGTVTGCNLFFYMKDSKFKEYNSLNGSCERYWEPYLTSQLGFGPSV